MLHCECFAHVGSTVGAFCESLPLSNAACVGRLCGKNSPLTLSMLRLFTWRYWAVSKCMTVSTRHSAARKQSDDTVGAVIMDFMGNKGYFNCVMDTAQVLLKTIFTTQCLPQVQVRFIFEQQLNGSTAALLIGHFFISLFLFWICWAGLGVDAGFRSSFLLGFFDIPLKERSVFTRYTATVRPFPLYGSFFKV